MGDQDNGDRLLPPPPPYSDELSSFLRQILSRSSPITQPSSLPPDTAVPMQQPLKRIVSVSEMFDRNFSSVSGEAVSSAGDAVPEISEDKYAFESNKARQRNPLKRNIDAQFHNLSEKKRRRKINEKMKALQKLIPNSSKTDKASMLEEAIEYLKQLQLQVQHLAVINGFGLNPMRLPTTQTRINHQTINQDLNLETFLHGK